MVIVDTNVLLRYLLNDNKELNKKSKEIIDNNDVFVPTEVIVEMGYVLQKVYKVERKEILNVVKELIKFENVHFQNESTILKAFEIYAEKSFDIVDCMLGAYKLIEKYDVSTLDEKLDKYLKKIK